MNSPEILINDGFRIAFDAMTRGVFIGQTGSGKTYAARRIIEQLYLRTPLVVLDPPGVWFGMRLMADGSPHRKPIPIIGGIHADIPLDPRQGEVYARWIVREHASAIIDLAGDLGVAEMRRFATAFLGELYRLKGSDPYPMHLVLEEADEFAPQSIGQEGGDLAKCQSVVDRVCRRGRTRGIGYSLITQRPAVLHKNVMNQGEVFFVGKLTGPTDRDAIADWFAAHGTKEHRRQVIDSLPTLGKGDAWWYDTRDDTLTRAKGDAIATWDSMRTPTAEDANRTITLGELDARALTAEVQKMAAEAKANDPKALKAEIARLRAEASKVKNPGTVDATALGELRSELSALRAANARAEAQVGKLRHRILTLEAEAAHGRQVVERIVEMTQACATQVRNTGRERPPKADAQMSLHVDQSPVRAEATSHRLQHETAPPARNPARSMVVPPHENLPRPHAKILGSCVWWLSLGTEAPSLNQVAIISGYTPTSGGFKNSIGAMRTAGLLQPAERDGTVRLTENGRSAAPDPPAIASLQDVHREIVSRLAGPHQKIARALLERREAMTTEELGEATGYTPTSGGFKNSIGAMRSLGLLRPAKRDGMVELEDIWFPDGLD